MDEVQMMERGILGSEKGATTTSSKGKQPWKRFDDVKSLKDDLLSQANQLQNKPMGDGDGGLGNSMPNLRVPSEIRKAKVAQVMSLLERETALVDAVKGRLERLSVG